MTDKKLTDNEIIKALEWHINEETHCSPCPYEEHSVTHSCVEMLIADTLDLINRLQAENEWLCVEIDELIIAKDLLFDEAEALIKKAKSEARKEFAERLKEEVKHIPWCDYPPVHEKIDNLLIEMESDDK